MGRGAAGGRCEEIEIGNRSSGLNLRTGMGDL
jgi:hypothetical protein